MPNCPECEPIAQQVYEVGVHITDLQGQTEPLRQRLQAGLRPYSDAMRRATEGRMHAEAIHASLVRAVADLVAEISAMTGAGATAVAGMIGSDVSFAPRDGWIEQRIGSQTLWFRTQQAIEQFGRAAGLQGMLDALAALRAREASSLRDVQDANGLESAAQDDLNREVDRANQRLQRHYDEIVSAEAEHQRLTHEYQLCLERCQHGATQDQRIGVGGVALMLAGMLVLATVGNPFARGANAADGAVGAGGEASSTAVRSTATALAVRAQVGPIGATFAQAQFTTYYVVPIDVPPGTPVEVQWSGADCGEWGRNGPLGFAWAHPHPPCDPSTSHADRTIIARVDIGGTRYECRYQGAESGFGPACTGPNGSTVAMVPGGTAATPAPTVARATSTTPAATVAAGGTTPTGTPGATPATTGGGTTLTPTATVEATSGGEGSQGGGSPGATAAGVGLTVVGGAAAGYSASRGGGTRTPPEAPSSPVGAPQEGTRTRHEGDDSESGADGGDGDGEDEADRTPPPPPITRPHVTIEAGGGGDALAKDQTFRVVVETPRPATGEPPETIDVTLRADRGDDETVTLRWTGNRTGPAVYRSEPLTIEHGGTGGGKTTVFGFEFSRGDMGDDLSDVPNGERVTVTVDGVTADGQDSATLKVYTTWVQEGIGRYHDAIERMCAYWANVTKLLEGVPDCPEKTRMAAHAAHIARLCEQAHRIEVNEHSLDTMKLALLRATWGIMSRGDLSQWDAREEMDIFSAARRSGEQMSWDSFMRGMSGAAIGMWRTAADVTGYADIVKIWYGEDEMGEKVGTLDRIFAALDLAGKITVYGQTESMLSEVADFLSAGATAGRVAVRAGQAAETLTAEAGKVVEWPEEFGMLRNRAQHFEDVAERYGVRIRVRPANEASLGWMAEGNPPKHVKLKSKTINELDELLGAQLGARGQVGYFEPRLPPLDNFDEATRAALIKRYSQRSMEFHDEAQAMASLEGKGLVRVEGGVVVDTGLSDTRLVGDHLEPLGVNPGGTGKAFTGDHDMWDITNADGSPLDAATKARVESDLMDGAAATQHGPHKDWVPETSKDRAIDQRIRESHGGQVQPDGSVRAGPGAEALIDFSPGQPPRISYEMGGGS
jgi:hypothetical protein